MLGELGYRNWLSVVVGTCIFLTMLMLVNDGCVVERRRVGWFIVQKIKQFVAPTGNFDRLQLSGDSS